MAEKLESINFVEGLTDSKFIRPLRMHFKRLVEAVFVRNILRLPENKSKELNEVDFQSYDIKSGKTLELCAGIIDKPKLSLVEVAKEEILEECGFDIPTNNIQHLRTGIGTSGAVQHLYFALISESEKVSEGGGNTHEGEFIEKVYLDIEETKQLLEESNITSPPSFLFGINWFLQNKKSLYEAK